MSLKCLKILIYFGYFGRFLRFIIHQITFVSWEYREGKIIGVSLIPTTISECMLGGAAKFGSSPAAMVFGMAGAEG